jgi:hypothetical protein
MFAARRATTAGYLARTIPGSGDHIVPQHFPRIVEQIKFLSGDADIDLHAGFT